MSREVLKNLIEQVPEEDVETLYKVIIRFVPTEKERMNQEYLAKIDRAIEQRKNGMMQEHEIIEVAQ